MVGDKMNIPLKKKGKNPTGRSGPLTKKSRKLPIGIGGMSKEFVEHRIASLLRTSPSGLSQILADDTQASFDHFVSAMILKGIQEGDPRRFDVLLNRVAGRVTEKIEYISPTPFLIESRDGSKEELGVCKEDVIDVNEETAQDDEKN